MRFYVSESVHKRPRESMLFWAIKEIVNPDSSRTRVLSGYVQRLGTFRVTTEIVFFERETMTIQTESGRIYNLIGEPGFDKVTFKCFWELWKTSYSIKIDRDVTNEYFKIH